VSNHTSQPPEPSVDDAHTQNDQDRTLAFVNASVDRCTASLDRVATPE
jgi:hypothetical protein